MRISQWNRDTVGSSNMRSLDGWEPTAQESPADSHELPFWGPSTTVSRNRRTEFGGLAPWPMAWVDAPSRLASAPSVSASSFFTGIHYTERGAAGMVQVQGSERYVYLAPGLLHG